VTSRVASREGGEHQWWRDRPRRVSIGPVKFVVAFLVLASWAWTLSYVGAFLLGLFVIAVLRHNARASGSRGGWRVWSIAWVLTWAGLGALALALGWGRWLGYASIVIALVAFMRLGPQRGGG
jgi:hypothetical protein